MHHTPRFKIYDASGAYRAATMGPMPALCLVSHYFGRGSTIRYNHQALLWTEGEDGLAFQAGALPSKCYERAYKIMEQRRGEWDRKRAGRAEKRQQKRVEWFQKLDAADAKVRS